MRTHRLARLLLALAVPATGLAAAGTATSAQAIPLCDVPVPPPICDGPIVTTTRPPTTTPTTTAPSSTATWFIDANTVRVNDAQEEGWFSNGDEFYIAQIGFRTTPGRPGSTSTFFQGGLTEVSGLKDGATKAIPDSMGRVRIANVTQRGFNDVLAGRNPEIVGSFSVVFESDLTSFGTVNNMMSQLAATARAEVARVSETMTLADLTDQQALANRLNQLSSRIASQAAPSTLQAIGIFLGSFGDPDDLVAFRVNVFAGVDASLAPLVDQALGAIPPTVGAGGALRDRSYAQRFNGDGADYNVSYRVSR